jgi:hypothetical protein
MAEMLLERGADPNGAVYASGTPLSEAYGQRDEKMIALLERYGGKSNPSMAGLYRSKDLALRLLAEHGDAYLPDDGFGKGTVAEQLIGAAARGGDPETLRLGMDRVDWPHGDPRWHGALGAPLGFWNHWIGPWCHLEWDRGTYLACFKMILERVDDPNRRIRFGLTILHNVVTMGDHVTADERVRSQPRCSMPARAWTCATICSRARRSDGPAAGVARNWCVCFSTAARIRWNPTPSRGPRQSHGQPRNSIRRSLQCCDERSTRILAMPKRLLIVALALLTTLTAQLGDPSPRPALQYLVDAFDRYPIVALSEVHGSPETMNFITALIRHPGFAGKVSDIVVEFGSGRYQTVMDRYIAGGDVREDELKAAWENTTQVSGVWSSPIYRGFLCQCPRAQPDPSCAAANPSFARRSSRRLDPRTGPADDDMNDWRDRELRLGRSNRRCFVKAARRCCSSVVRTSGVA